MQESVTKLPGPEQPSAVERVVQLTRLPYALGCVVIGCLIGAPGFFLFYFADSLSISQALKQLTSGAFFTIGRFGQPLPFTQGLAVAILYTVFLIMTLYFARYLRVASFNVEYSMVTLNPAYAGEEHQRTFGGISNLKFVLLLTAAFSLLYVPSRIIGAAGGFSLISALVVLPLDFFVVAGTLWIYLRSLWGVYKFGSGPLSLVPYYKDRMLGLHPVGALSLSFGIVYLLLDSLALVAGALTADIADLAVLFGLLILLAAMLFLPLNGIHHKMQAEKLRTRAELNSKIAEIAAGGTADERASLSDLKYLLAYRSLSGEAAKIPTWPFDTGRLERFLAVFLSVTAIIIARLIQIAAHL